MRGQHMYIETPHGGASSGLHYCLSTTEWGQRPGKKVELSVCKLTQD